MEEILAGFSSDGVKTSLRRVHCFKMTLPLLQVLQKSLPIHLSLCHTQQSIMNGSVGEVGRLPFQDPGLIS